MLKKNHIAVDFLLSSALPMLNTTLSNQQKISKVETWDPLPRDSMCRTWNIFQKKITECATHYLCHDPYTLPAPYTLGPGGFSFAFLKCPFT